MRAPGVFHWTHEWLAFETSFSCLRASGLEPYARENEDWLRGQVGDVTLQQVVTERLEHPYVDRYGRIFLLGGELCDAVGWEHAKRLATSLNDRYEVDLRLWIDALPRNLEKKVRGVLRVPEDRWV
jgi:hypothetical protein